MKHPEAPGFRLGRPISGHNANAPVKPHEATRDVRSTTTDLNSRENTTPVARAKTEHRGENRYSGRSHKPASAGSTPAPAKPWMKGENNCRIKTQSNKRLLPLLLNIKNLHG